MTEHERDPDLERHLTEQAAASLGLIIPGTKRGNTYGLIEFAQRRAAPFGPIRAGLNPDAEVADELADAVNYLTFGLTRIQARYLDGDPDVIDDWERWMRTLRGTVDTWKQLRTTSH